ncbi:MAG TPA: hypothetical protein VGX48_17730 [Pyrinomonadaceae bacterium]|jgi:hypothetical protein|nr:hypothetical protein [Pyrinomonadaceae bacterium]
MAFNLSARNRRRAITVARWALPFVASAVASCFIAWGSINYAKGAEAQRLTTVERDVQAVKSDVDRARGEHGEFVRRDAFQIVLDDLKEIKGDVREVRQAQRQMLPAPAEER